MVLITLLWQEDEYLSWIYKNVSEVKNWPREVASVSGILKVYRIDLAYFATYPAFTEH